MELFKFCSYYFFVNFLLLCNHCIPNNNPKSNLFYPLYKSIPPELLYKSCSEIFFKINRKALAQGDLGALIKSLCHYCFPVIL